MLKRFQITIINSWLQVLILSIHRKNTDYSWSSPIALKLDTFFFFLKCHTCMPPSNQTALICAWKNRSLSDMVQKSSQVLRWVIGWRWNIISLFLYFKNRNPLRLYRHLIRACSERLMVMFQGSENNNVKWKCSNNQSVVKTKIVILVSGFKKNSFDSWTKAVLSDPFRFSIAELWIQG